ncbi:hypothetical protein H6P81_003622 [Aristolochia fimbriata]|uniref:C2H2-type domain-containing protein n=1 Tax=Aristolochia fimbriata TaxID=158543 RepID=A0AAV7FF20_ARIFI|nr:hypothetical protein H6P81_003622 [Aristolochia fimbriata]
MEFWGKEVKSGERVKCDPGPDKYLHLSQATIGEVKKDKASDVLLSVKVDDQKLNSCLFITGEESSDSEEDSEDDVPVAVPLNGKPDGNVAEIKPSSQKANAVKAESSAAKAKGKVAEQMKVEKRKEDEDEDDNDESEEAESDSEDIVGAGDESEDDEGDEDEEDEDSSEEEETPNKAEIGKKRTQESSSKTPAPEKKAKLVTPPGKKSGPDGKKTSHTPTPHPKKTVAKTSGEGDKSKQQTPKPTGQFSCNSCNRTFNSENALQSHNKAKHSEGK